MVGLGRGYSAALRDFVAQKTNALQALVFMLAPRIELIVVQSSQPQIKKVCYPRWGYQIFCGGLGEDRTRGQLVKSQMLYH